MKRFFTGYICGLVTCALVYIGIYLYSDTVRPNDLQGQRSEVEMKIDTLGIKEWPLEKQKAFFDSVLEKHRKDRTK